MEKTTSCIRFRIQSIYLKRNLIPVIFREKTNLKTFNLRSSDTFFRDPLKWTFLIPQQSNVFASTFLRGLYWPSVEWTRYVSNREEEKIKTCCSSAPRPANNYLSFSIESSSPRQSFCLGRTCFFTLFALRISRSNLYAAGGLEIREKKCECVKYSRQASSKSRGTRVHLETTHCHSLTSEYLWWLTGFHWRS